MLSHLTDDYSRFGNLDKVSAFQFKSYLGSLKRMLKSGFLPLKQIIARLDERKNIKIKTAKESKIKNEYVYLINTNECCVVKNQLVKNNNTDLIYCKYYKLKSLYEYPCESILFGIYSAYNVVLQLHYQLHI